MTTHIICRIYSCMNKALSIEPSGYCFPACWTPHNESLADNYFHICGIICQPFQTVRKPRLLLGNAPDCY